MDIKIKLFIYILFKIRDQKIQRFFTFNISKNFYLLVKESLTTEDVGALETTHIK